MANMLILLMLLSFGANALEVTSPPDYTIGTVAVGTAAYSDRAYRFTNVGKYAGYEFVVSRNSDKTTTSITLPSAGKIYLAKQNGVSFGGWDATGDRITLSNGGYDVYVRDFAGQPATIGPACEQSACSMHIVMAEAGPPPNPFTGKVTALWSHDYKTTDEVDVDVLSYGVYAQGSHVREVQDDDTGNISTEFLFPSEVSVSDGTEWCVQVDAASAETRSDLTAPVCVVLKNEGPIVLPNVPTGVQLEITQ